MTFGIDIYSLGLSIIFFITIWKLIWKNDKAAMIDKIPGPKAFPLVGNVLEILEPKEKMLENILKRKNKFGPIFRLWIGTKPTIILSRAEEIELLLKTSKHSEKSFIYKFLYPWLGTGLLTAHGKKWATHRKLITPTFHFAVLQSFVRIFAENADILVRKLEKMSETGEEFDIYPMVTLCTLDNICETAMGTKINAQLNSNSDYVKSVYRLSALVLHRASRAWLHPDFTFYLSPAGREFRKHLGIVQGFTENVIKAKRKALESQTPDESEVEERKKLTFLHLLIKTSAEEGSIPLTDAELREEVNTFMFAGHDTTGASTNWTLFLLGHHPDIQEDVHNEVKAIFESNEANGRSLSITDLSEMKLLERVIKETMRLWPSVSGIGRILEEDVDFGGYKVPKGTYVNVNIFCLHRDPNYFQDPEKFDPDRFLPENAAKRNPYAYLPFSAGPRNCIGQKFAILEEKVILSSLLYKYKIESLEKIEDVKKIPEIIVRPQFGIKLKITKR